MARIRDAGEGYSTFPDRYDRTTPQQAARLLGKAARINKATKVPVWPKSAKARRVIKPVKPVA